MAYLHAADDVTSEVLRFAASAMCEAAPPIVMPSVFVFVGRLNHRMDELARCVEAALWGTTGRAVEAWLLLLNVDGTRYSYARVGREIVDALGPSPSEGALLTYLAALTGYEAASPSLPLSPQVKAQAAHSRGCGGRTFASVRECLADAERAGVFVCTHEDVWVELHEDAPLPLTLPEATENTASEQLVAQRAGRDRARRWRRGIYAFGVHEDFMQEVADATAYFARACGDRTRMSLGPVALHSSACVHAMLGFLHLPAPAYPLRVYSTLATTLVAGAGANVTSALRLKPTVDPENSMRCVPNRGAIHFWVNVASLTPGHAGAGDAADAVAALGRCTDGYKLARLAALYSLWASKSTYRAADTKITFVLPSGAAVTYDRSLLDFMPRDEDGGNAPNEKNINVALAAAGAGTVQEEWTAHLEDVTRKHAQALALQLELDDAGAPAFPDAPEVPVEGPQPRGAPLHVLVGLAWPQREGLGGLEVQLLRCRLRGVPAAANAPSAAVPRALVLLQSLHSLGRLKPIVAAYGRTATAETQMVALPADVARWDATRLRQHWAGLEYGDVAPMPHDTVSDATVLCVEGYVTAVRAQGNVVFMGVRDDAGERVQVLMNLRGWPTRWVAAVRKLNSNDRVALAGVTGHSTQGRLSLFVKSVLSIDVAPAEDAGTVVVHETAELVVVSKPCDMTAHPHATMRASERPTALCEAMRLYKPPANDSSVGDATTAPAPAPTHTPPAAEAPADAAREENNGTADNGAPKKKSKPRKERPANKLYPVHMLEKDNSGLVVFAKDSRVADAAALEVKAGAKYFVVVAACPEGAEAQLPREGEVWTRDEPLKEVVRDRKAGKAGKSRRQAPRVPTPARTVFQCLLSVPKARAVVLCAIPLSQGTRQIRRHLALQDLYVIGDHLQGNGTMNRTFQKTYAFRATAMHLHTLVTDRRTFTAPIPPPLRALIQSMPCDSRRLLTDPFPFTPLEACNVRPLPPAAAPADVDADGCAGCCSPATAVDEGEASPPSSGGSAGSVCGVRDSRGASRGSTQTVPMEASPEMSSTASPVVPADGDAVPADAVRCASILKSQERAAAAGGDRRVLIDESSTQVCSGADDAVGSPERCCSAARVEYQRVLEAYRMPYSESGGSSRESPYVHPLLTPDLPPRKASPTIPTLYDLKKGGRGAPGPRPRIEVDCQLCGGCSVM